MNTYKKHPIHQNATNAITKKRHFIDLKKEKNSNSKIWAVDVFSQRKMAKKNPMKLASSGRVMSRGDKNTMKVTANKLLEEKVKVAEKIAAEMIKIACLYAEKWGSTSGVGFVTRYLKQDRPDIILNRKKLEQSLKKQEKNLIATIQNNGVVCRGNIPHGTTFELNASSLNNTIIEILVNFMKRIGIAVATEKNVKFLEQVFDNLGETGNFKFQDKGGISSKIAGVARFSYANLKSEYKKNGIDGWRNLFKKLNEAYRSTELENEEFSKHSDGKKENADADLFASASKYTPPETEMKKEIEDNAIKKAKRYYKNKGYTVTSVEKENCGWDLTVISRDSKELHIEVKGTSRNEFHFFLSKNEYNQMKIDSNWRLFVAKNVLEDPDPDFVVKRPENVEKMFDLVPFCFEGTWKDE